MIFFLVNSVGETFVGIQIGSHSSNVDSSAAGYGVIDIILSGETIDSQTVSWVVQDGLGSNFGPNVNNFGHSGRVTISNLQGKGV